MAHRYLQELTAQSSASSTDVVPIADSSTGQLKKITVDNLVSAGRKLNLGTEAELTISSGSITLTGSAHSIDTEADAAADDLATITFPSGITLAVIRSENAARVVSLKHGTGNIKTPTGNDWVLPANGFAVVYYDGSFAQVVGLPLEDHTHPASEISSGTLTHERGGLAADVSAYDGIPKIAGGATSELKINLAGTTAPTANEDTGDGYSPGSLWVDTTNDLAYICLDATAAAAVWTEITNVATAFSINSLSVIGAVDWGSDRLAIYDNTFGDDRKITPYDLFAAATTPTIDGYNDYVMTIDVSDNDISKILARDLPIPIRYQTVLSSLDTAADTIAVYDDSAQEVVQVTPYNFITQLTEDTSPHKTNDFVITRDASAATLKKVTLENIYLDSNGFFQLPTNTNAGRGAAGTAGRVFFNTDDGQLNIDDGTNWTLPDGTTT